MLRGLGFSSRSKNTYISVPRLIDDSYVNSQSGDHISLSISLKHYEYFVSLDSHTIGIVVSFFDQPHGPIPIIIIPEISKDNFTKLVDLSDRSFIGTGFSDNFTVEIHSLYDFVLALGANK